MQEPPRNSFEDQRLSELLRTWQIDARDDPALASRVWRQIRVENAHTDPGWVEALLAVFARPVVAFATVAVVAIGGALIGSAQVSQRREARLTQLASEYVRSIDPVQLTSGGGHIHR